MAIKNPNDFLNTPAFEALRKMQEQFNNSAFAVTMRELQRTIDAVKVPTPGMTAAIQAYQDSVAPLATTIQSINNLYAPILEQTRMFEGVYNKSMAAALQSSIPAMKAMASIDFSTIQSIADAFPKYEFLSESILKNIDFSSVAEMYDTGTITDEDIAEEFGEIVAKKNLSISESWDNVKKSKWFLAIRWLLVILMFLGNPVVDKVKDNTLVALGVNDFWEESGIYEWLDELFGIEVDSSAVTEAEAKETVDQEKTGNISKQKREDLLAKIKEIRTFISAAPQDANTGNLLSYLSDLEKDINGKKYGLIFEEHREEIDEVLATHTPVLTEQRDLYIVNGGEMNFLIEGDNLASLKLLEKTHIGEVDLIYIDPPYNTGHKDFIYNDSYIGRDDGFCHSKWLSFMSQRLEIARNLLRDEGCIFISIGDGELASLRLLCDEIFGEINFLSVITRPTGTHTGVVNKALVAESDYLLVYCKNIGVCALDGLPLSEKDKKIYDMEDESGRFLIRPLRRTGGENRREDRPNMYFPITAPDGTQVYPIGPTGYESRWICNQDGYAYFESEGRIYWKKVNGKWQVYQKFYLQDKRKAVSNLWNDLEGNKKATRELQTILMNDDVKFDFPKPTQLIEKIVKMWPEKDATILDFFAGSGTTGHAVMKLNAEDGGNRRFILCTNNENNICRDVTYERIKRVIDKEGYTASLKYFKVDYIPVSERMYYEYADELLSHIRELVELENGINFTGNAEIGIVLNEEELDEFIANTEAFAKCRKLYMGHDLLPSDEQEHVLRKNGIEISIIPDYYYRDLEEG